MVKPNFHCSYTDRALRLHFSQDPNGLQVKVKPCCVLHEDMVPRDHVRFEPYTGLDQIYNNPGLKFYDDWFKNNTDFHASCLTCSANHFAGRRSNKDIINDLAIEHPEFDYLVVDVAIGNKCNLACAFCIPEFSSLIEKITRERNAADLPETWQVPAPPAPDPQSVGQVVAEILQDKQVRTLKFVGGEPLLAENWQPVGDILDSGTQSHLNLEITSNGTVLNQKILDNFASVNDVLLRLSIDGIGANYELMRWPHSWAKMERNLEFLIANQPDNVRVKIAVLANVMNFEYLPEIANYFERLGLDFWINYNIKPDDGVLHWDNLPREIVEHVALQLTNTSAINGLRYANEQRGQRTQHEVKREIEWFLRHRKMAAAETLGPKTCTYLGLDK